ncbi:helix-turn-helix transcriptional regulator [Antarcticibacterium flavum]|uniref:Helix-turn-helix transcriptional regulator n=1 Tax=Antarcticibacterium flavum TaxID=2058175 RepID=A0A5B7X3P9_9FLAO|nr:MULTISPECIES: AraC family transcriptional regulator [Antarcticibacterium]MCM4161466.1 AraC family transcriptional regulator [Antarcticibacterium sp. W02-3]QCY69298.1 helix-turn-helix transcriptional regulator [Antarcticibacterium flavum]
MRIDVKTLPVNEIITDLSKHLDTPVDNRDAELLIQLPENLGEGYIKGSSFDCGMGIISYNCKFHEDTEICFTLNTVHPLKFIFCSEGEVAHAFQESEELHKIEAYQNIIVSSSGYNGHKLFFKANVRTHVSSLEIIRSTFAHRTNYGFRDLEPTLKELFKDAVSSQQFFYQGNYSIRAADLMEELNSRDYTGFLRSLYLEGKSYDMLVIQIAQYQDDESVDRLPTILRKSDIEKVDYVARRILGDLGSNLTVESLAKEAGTNVNKLQEGFKYVYDLTVNKFIQHKKLEAAKDMLLTTDKNISEIVTAIGLNNRSYFSKIFKEKYGVNPKYFLKTRKAEV